MSSEPLCIEMVDDQMAEVFREKSESERLAIAHGMWSSARTMICNILKDQHPEWDAHQIEHEAARRLSHGAV